MEILFTLKVQQNSAEYVDAYNFNCAFTHEMRLALEWCLFFIHVAN